ncbi:MAG: hypothetical protein BRC25_02215 [Parcubacteria group bacterium SW_6_46_9]|nr:MAG: hypothetical protein BRC25_02215 [Parcubacteria group bacterium SW_6_46_9]
MTNLNDIFAFDDMLHKLHLVKRSELARGKDRRENDWEHGYQMAMLCWYLADSSEELNLNLKKVIAYALAHDVVEVYAGDTPFHQTDEKKTS